MDEINIFWEKVVKVYVMMVYVCGQICYNLHIQFFFFKF